MAEFTGTRSELAKANAYEAVVRGIAPDGGLYVPENLPRVAAEETLCLTYAQTAKKILGGVLGAFSKEEISESCDEAYPARFDTAEVCPLVKAGDGCVLELFHGETAAFKDIALSILPRLMIRAQKALGMREKLMILTATSGDTGSAAMNGFRNVPGTGILVFYPKGGVSEIQYRQMACMPGENVCACALDGNFDDCQSAVKRAFTGLTPPEGIRFSSANSINIARLAPQIAYYYAAYAGLVRKHGLKIGAEADFIVPTGNFGDILAGYYAKRMGLPVGRLVCASNANRVLTDFIQTGVYDARRPFHKTLSPSMDILISSNLERLIYHAEGDDARAVAAHMQSLRETGAYRASDAAMARIRETFTAYSFTDSEMLASMALAWNEWGYLADPHTSVALAAMRAYARENPGRKTVVLATASPAKFPQSALRALDLKTKGDAFQMLDALSAHTRLCAPPSILGLRGREIRFRDETNAAGIQEYILGKAEKLCQL